MRENDISRIEEMQKETLLKEDGESLMEPTRLRQ